MMGMNEQRCSVNSVSVGAGAGAGAGDQDAAALCRSAQDPFSRVKAADLHLADSRWAFKRQQYIEAKLKHAQAGSAHCLLHSSRLPGGNFRALQQCSEQLQKT